MSAAVEILEAPLGAYVVPAICRRARGGYRMSRMVYDRYAEAKPGAVVHGELVKLSGERVGVEFSALGWREVVRG